MHAEVGSGSLQGASFLANWISHSRAFTTCRAASGSKIASVRFNESDQAAAAIEKVCAGRRQNPLVEIGAAAVVPNVIEREVEIGQPEELGLRQLGLRDPRPGLRAATISGLASGEAMPWRD